MRKLLVKALDCFFLLRIPLLAPVWTVLILGWISGNGNARLGGVLRAEYGGEGEQILWLSLLGFSLIVAAIYVTNQIADIDSDRINHKLFLLPRGILSIATAWVCALLCACAGLLVAFFLLDAYMGVLFVLSLLLGMLYNFPPARLKDRAWGGTIANFVGHGVLTYLVGWYAAHFGESLTCASMLKALTASCAAGFANAAVYITTTIPDAEGDRITGKHTFCVTYGERFTAVAAAIACASALAFSFVFEHNAWVMAVPAAVSLVIFIMLVVQPRRENAFKAFKWPVFILTASVAVFVPVYALLILVTFAGSRIYYKFRFHFDYPTFKAQ